MRHPFRHSKPSAFGAICLVLSSLASGPLAAGGGNLALEGNFIQGGLVFGSADPGTRVALDGQEVRVSADGRFVFGFTRDAPAQAELIVTYPDGSTESRRLQIEKRDYKVQRIDGLPPKMVSPPESVWKRIKAENAMIGKVRLVDRETPYYRSGFVWPTIGRISGVYGSQRILNGKPKQPHYGIDIAAPEGTPVRAPADGVVVLVHRDMYYTGGTIIVDHGHGLTSTFIHMKDISVEEGQELRQGAVIGTVGATGRATGPHLDWRINWFKARIDPSLLVGPMPQASAN